MLHKLWIPAIPNGRTRSKFIEHWEHGEYTWKTSTRRLDLRRFKTLDLWPKHSILRHYGMAMVGKSLHMSLGQLKIRECQVTCGGLCNILASQQSPEQNFGHFHPLVYYFPGFLGFFLKDPPRHCLLTENQWFQRLHRICPSDPKRLVADWPMEKSDSFFWGCDVAAATAHATPSVSCTHHWWPGGGLGALGQGKHWGLDPPQGVLDV